DGRADEPGLELACSARLRDEEMFLDHMVDAIIPGLRVAGLPVVQIERRGAGSAGGGSADHCGQPARKTVTARIDLREVAVDPGFDECRIAGDAIFLRWNDHLGELRAGDLGYVFAADLRSPAALPQDGLGIEGCVETDHAVAFLPRRAGVVEGARIGL